MKLENYNLKEKIAEMLDDFGGYTDFDSIVNIKTKDGLVQLKFVLVHEDQYEFSEYKGIETINITDLK